MSFSRLEWFEEDYDGTFVGDVLCAGAFEEGRLRAELDDLRWEAVCCADDLQWLENECDECGHDSRVYAADDVETDLRRAARKATQSPTLEEGER